MAPFRGILFDLDGTILDTATLITNSFKHVFKTYCDRELSDAEVHEFFGKPLRTAFINLAPDRVDELVAAYKKYNLAHHDRMALLFPEAKETLLALHNSGIKLGIVTSKTKELSLRGLNLHQLVPCFETIIGCDECNRHKPDPDPVNTALKELNLTPDEVLMVGDAPADILSGQGAGCKTAAVRWTLINWQELESLKPDYQLTRFSELKDICQLQVR